jgi:hypothetical protein
MDTAAKLGAHVAFPNEENHRTPDIRAAWEADIVDVEVTTPLTKDRQEELQRVMDLIRQVIANDLRSWHPLIHLANLPATDVQSQILDAMISLEPGKRTGVERMWDVCAVPADQPSALVDQEQLDALRPDWWGDDGPTLNNATVTISADLQHERRTLICSKLPFLSCLNSIRSKVDRPQRDPNYPYLVVVDQSAMPVRHAKLQHDLAAWLPQWDHVGGILCFDIRPAYCGPFEWQLSFHPNPHATLPLPVALRSMNPPDQKVGVDFFA